MNRSSGGGSKAAKEFRQKTVEGGEKVFPFPALPPRKERNLFDRRLKTLGEGGGKRSGEDPRSITSQAQDTFPSTKTKLRGGEQVPRNEKKKREKERMKGQENVPGQMKNLAGIFSLHWIRVVWLLLSLSLSLNFSLTHLSLSPSLGTHTHHPKRGAKEKKRAPTTGDVLKKKKKKSNRNGSKKQA
jgi:hypothetical protein